MTSPTSEARVDRRAGGQVKRPKPKAAKRSQTAFEVGGHKFQSDRCVRCWQPLDGIYDARCPGRIVPTLIDFSPSVSS